MCWRVAARRSCESGAQVLFVPPVLADGYAAIAKRICQPARHDRHQTLMVAHMGFVRAAEIYMGKLMRDDAEQVAFDGVWVKIDRAFFIAHRPLAKLLIRGPLDAHRPPLAVQAEAEGWPLLAIFHLSSR